MESIKNIYKIGYGPSSSHTIGPTNAALHIKSKYDTATSYEFHLYNSLSLTGSGHQTSDAIDSVLKNVTYLNFIDHNQHPNLFIVKSYNGSKLLGIDEFVSLGGGALMINGTIPDSKEVYPHNSFSEIKEYCQTNNLSLYDYILHFEKDISFMDTIFETMIKVVKNGLNKEGYLPGELKVLRKAKIMKKTSLKNDTRRGLISSYAFSAAEENASGGLIVTAPTCGASGVLPALAYHAYHNKHYHKELIIASLLVGGLIGNIIKKNASISGAVAGCQAEMGSATAMASAMLCYLDGDDVSTIECASEIAIEHSLGLTCDPIMGYVQIPCIERNVFAALRAIDCANIAKGIVSKNIISLDTIIHTMYETGLDLPSKYKETSLGGLAKVFIEKNKK